MRAAYSIDRLSPVWCAASPPPRGRGLARAAVHGTLALALALAALPRAHAADLPSVPPAAVAPAATGTGGGPQVAPGTATTTTTPATPAITAGAAPELVSPLAAPPATIAPPATAPPAVTAQPTATQPTTAAQPDAGPPPAAAPQAAAQPAGAPGEAGQQPAAAQPPAGAMAPVPATPAIPAIIAPPPLPPPPMPPVHFDAALGVPKNRYGKLIYQTALRYALNPLLMAAIMRAESDFNPRARSRKGALGLMQVLPATGRRFGVARRRDLLNPKKNIETAGRYLRWLVDRFGEDPVRILAAYNAGEGAVDRFGGVPPFAETRDYVQRILGYLGFTAALLDAPVTATAAAVAGSAIPAASSK